MNVLIQLPDAAIETIDKMVAQNKAQALPGLATKQELAESLRIARAQGVNAANVYLRAIAKERLHTAPPRSRSAVVRMLVLQGLEHYKPPASPPAARANARRKATATRNVQDAASV